MQSVTGIVTGNRSLVSVLVGLEASRRASGRGPFAFAGVGSARYTISGATAGWFTPIPGRGLTTFGFGAGVGFRSASRVGAQAALRYQGAIHSKQLVARGTFATLGVAF